MQIGTGWLGWTERETLETTIPTIELAYEGHLEKLRLVQAGMFGLAESPEPTEPPPSESIFGVFRDAGTKPDGMR